jgi:hypothetical protein
MIGFILGVVATLAVARWAPEFFTTVMDGIKKVV